MKRNKKRNSSRDVWCTERTAEWDKSSLGRNNQVLLSVAQHELYYKKIFSAPTTGDKEEYFKLTG
jgi:hypothetical protein